MSWVSRLFGQPEHPQKKSKTNSLLLQGSLGQPTWTGTDFHALAKEGYSQNVYVFACVHQIAMACAGIPWTVYQRDRNGEIIEVVDSPLVRILRRPNPALSWSKFMDMVVSFFMLSGNSYIEAVGPDTGGPRELYVLHSSRVKVVPGDSQHLVGRYEYDINGRKLSLPAESILHLKTFHPLNDWYGLSPLSVAAKSVDQNNEGRKWNVALLQNSGRPPGALRTDANLTDTQFEDLERMLNDRYMGTTNAGRPLILEGGLAWDDIGMSPADMHWLEGAKLSAREIAIAFGVPPELIGDTSNKTYSNYKEARQAFYMETVLPLMDVIKGELNTWLVPKFGDSSIYVDYNKDEIEALQEERGMVWSRAVEGVKSGILTANEARALLGYESITGADMLMIPGTMVPLATAGGEDFGDDE